MDGDMERPPANASWCRAAQRLILSLLAPLVLAWLAVEWFSHSVLPVVPDSGEVARNPYRYRGWPEYMGGMDAPRSPDVGRCVLISDCQGYGGEYRDRMIYAAELAKRLGQARAGGKSDWQVHNWSVDGATSLDYVFLAAFLVEHPPDVVIALTSFADYRAEHFHEGLAFSRTDISRLVVRREVRRALPAGFLARHGRTEDVLRSAAHDALAALRFREYAWSWAERRFPGVLNDFYAARLTYLPWHLPKNPLVKPIERPPREETELTIAYDADSRRMLEEYVATLARIPADVRILAAEPYNDPDDERAQRMVADAEALCAENGLTFRDLRRVLAADEFLTSAHLSRGGHVRMAETLDGLVQDTLRGD
jgi:hypothetical protein